MLSLVEQSRLRISKNTSANWKSQLGQFLTPATTAEFMASLFKPTTDVCRLLDPGAGIGSLSSAFLERCLTADLKFKDIELSAFELDDLLHNELNRTLAGYTNKLPFQFEIFGGDFIEQAVNNLQFGSTRFTHTILNPPYKKINSTSRSRLLLRQAGIETVNLYSAFLALSIELMSSGGQIVAIIPRSFCNGPYYRPFRELLLKRTAIQHIHLFDSRNKTFKDDGVLQENIIISQECGGLQGLVTVTTSSDYSFQDLSTHQHPFERDGYKLRRIIINLAESLS